MSGEYFLIKFINKFEADSNLFKGKLETGPVHIREIALFVYYRTYRSLLN